MKKIIKLTTPAVFFGLALALAICPAFAQVQTGLSNLKGVAGDTGLSSAGGSSLPAIIGSIVTILLGTLGAILVLLFIYAGFIWMTAQGDDKKVAKAKDMIKNAVIGLIIVFSAYAIASFALSQLSKLGTGTSTVIGAAK